VFPRKFNPIIILLLGLATFGFVITLFTNPMSLVKMVLIMAAVGGLFYFLYKRFIAARTSKDFGQYKQAARYSAKKYQNDNPGNFISRKIKPSQKPKAKPSFTKTKKRNNNHNFKVIEGKKGKKKNRAL
jgi:hypothetical protein